MHFRFNAISNSGAVVTELLEAASEQEAIEAVRQRGLMLMNMQPVSEAPAGGGVQINLSLQRGVTLRDLVLFARQMKMLLTSGSTLVSALEAVEHQARRPAVRTMLAELREHVENGGTLTDGLRLRPDVFKPVFCSMVAAGEATASLPDAFERIASITQRQQQIRKAVVSAMVYPAALSVLCVGVVALMIGFVVPRFRVLFENLHTDLPTATRIMFGLADFLRDGWPVVLAGTLLLIGGTITAFQVPASARQIARWSLRLPMLGLLIARLQLGRILRVWAAMLKSNVALLETLEQSRAASRNPAFEELVDHLVTSISSGGHIGDTLERSRLVPPIVTSAIRTGEENGRLAEAVDFVSAWIDEENTQMVASMTRIAEPAMLAIMGIVVGTVAMSLFMPLFDMATAGH